MIRVDRSLQESVNILPDSHLAWQPNDSDFIQHLDHKDQPQLCPPTPTDPPRDRSSSLSPAPDTNSPQTQPEAPSSPVTAEEREEAVKVPQREEEEEEETRVEKASRLSTPLSELSPPPDDLDVTVDPSSPNDDAGAVSDGTAAMTLPIPVPSPSKSPDAPAEKPGPSKVLTILDLNSELLQCVSQRRPNPRLLIPHPIVFVWNFRKKPSRQQIHCTTSMLSLGHCIVVSHIQFISYCQRLQSNLTWLAAVADQSRPMVSLCHSIRYPINCHLDDDIPSHHRPTSTR